MNLISNNVIDKKLSDSFPKDIIENIIPEKIEYLGISINSLNSDIAFRAYYNAEYSENRYEESKDEPLINFLYEKDMIARIELVNNSSKQGLTTIHAAICHRTNENMSDLFSYLEENISFFSKYKNEIIELSKMIVNPQIKNDHAAMYFITVTKDSSGIKVLKCYFQNCVKKNGGFPNQDYYFTFLEKCSVDKLKELLPIAKSAIENTQGILSFEGINYNENTSEKHKIYIQDPQNLYEGLFKTFSNNAELKNQINLIKEWHEVHPEFFCDGFCIGKDDNDNLILNLYFGFVQEDNPEDEN